MTSSLSVDNRVRIGAEDHTARVAYHCLRAHSALVETGFGFIRFGIVKKLNFPVHPQRKALTGSQNKTSGFTKADGSDREPDIEALNVSVPRVAGEKAVGRDIYPVQNAISGIPLTAVPQTPVPTPIRVQAGRLRLETWSHLGDSIIARDPIWRRP